MLIFAGFLAGAAALSGLHYFPLITTLLLCLLVGSLYYSFRPRLRMVGGFLVACIAGFSIAATGQGTSVDLTKLEGKTIAAHGTPITDTIMLDASRGLMAQTFRLSTAVDSEGSIYPIRRLRVLSDRPFSLDRSYSLTVRMPREIVTCNPGPQQPSLTGFLFAAEEASPGLLAPFARMRSSLHRFFLDHFDRNTGPFLISIVTGERGYLSRELNQAFGITGLAHILSISGTHFGLVFYALFHLCRTLFLRLPERMLRTLTLSISPSQAGAVLALPAVVLYLGISDMSYPAIRSFVMIMLFLLGLLLSRKGMWLNTLLFAAVLIVAFDPEALTDLSFQLSFLASLCIGLVSDRLRSQQDSDQNRDTAETIDPPSSGKRYLSRSLKLLTASLCISIAASLGTAPLVAYQFHYASLISPLTNLVLTPLIGLLVLPFALAGSFCYLFTGIFPFAGSLDSITSAMLYAVQICSDIPLAAVRLNVWPAIILPVFYGLLLGAVWLCVIIPRLRGDNNPLLPKACAALLITLCMIAGTWSILHHQEGIFITYLDTGQGDAAVLELPDNRVMVIDTGRNYQPLISYLRSRGVRSIEALVLSHAHPDHTSGFAALMRDFQVNELWDNGRLKYGNPLPAGIVHRPLERGDILNASGYRFTVLHPYPEYRAEKPVAEENNDSLVLKLEAFGNSILFTGDIAVDAEESMLPLGGTLASTVIKVPHHGSRTSLSEPFLRSIHPRYAVISVGRKNRYGHPHPATIEVLGTTVTYRTDRDGAIGMHLKPDGSLLVKTWQQARLQPVSTVLDERKNAERLLAVW